MNSVSPRKAAYVSGAHYPLLLGVFWFDSARGRASILVLVGLISFFAWFAALRRSRLIVDTPSSKIRSAAQGYVELAGSAQPLGDQPLKDPVMNEPCLWFRVETYKASTIRRRGVRHTSWLLIKSAESARPVLLKDSTGSCQIMPQGAEFVLDSPQRVRDGAELEHRISRIRAGDQLYALGLFKTVNEAPAPAPTPIGDIATIVKDVSQRTTNIVENWQAAPHVLIAKFDANRDGTLDTAEQRQVQAAAVQAARAAYDRDGNANTSIIATNVMTAPDDGRLYLISNRQARATGAHYRNWGWIHFVFFLLGLIAAGWLV